MWSGHIPSVVTSGFQSKSECISTTEVSHGNIPRPCKFVEIYYKARKSHPFSVKKLEAKISTVNIKLMVVLNSNWFGLNFISYWVILSDSKKSHFNIPWQILYHQHEALIWLKSVKRCNEYKCLHRKSLLLLSKQTPESITSIHKAQPSAYFLITIFSMHFSIDA